MADPVKVSGEEGQAPKDLISTLRRRRGVHKRKVSLYLNKLRELKTSSQLTPTFCSDRLKIIDTEIEQISKFDEEINKVMEQCQLTKTDEEFYNEELDSQAEYSLEIGLELDSYYVSPQKDLSERGSTEILLDALSKLNNSNGKPPPPI